MFVLAALALMRRQELGGFIEGLFGQEDVVDLPERVHRGLDILGELHALFAAVLAIATHETKAATDKSMETTPRHMTKNAEQCTPSFCPASVPVSRCLRHSPQRSRACN